MRRSLTLGQYRGMDLFFFAVMLLISEYLIITAATHWFPAQPYTVSVAAALVTIVLVRWGGFASILAVWAGLVFCFFSGGTPKQYLIYGAGNLLSMGSLLLIRFLGAEEIRKDAFKALSLAFVTQLLMQAGRAAAALLTGASPAACLAFFTTDALSMLFTLVIIWITRRLDGMLEDQIHYLRRIQAQQEKEKEQQL